jgi:hypothetical protein
VTHQIRDVNAGCALADAVDAVFRLREDALQQQRGGEKEGGMGGKMEARRGPDG